MRIRGWGRIKDYTRTIQSQLGANAVILIYHRVAECDSDPQRLVVSPSHFSQQMEVLAATTCPVPLETLSVRLKKRKRSERPLSAVTFDDGYTDNLEQAAPILARHSIPATVFVSTATINRHHEFYWDELERIFLHSSLPARLELKIGDQAHTWTFDDNHEPSVDWNVRQAPLRTSQKAYLEIAEQVMNLIPAEREKVMNQLIEWAGISGQPRSDHQTMTADELRRLTADGLISVGAHTVNHPVLASLDASDQAFEIQASRDHLEQILGHPVRTFSYPYGRAQDYSRRTVKLVREAGFTCACANFPRVVSPWTDPLQLPRFGVGNWTGELFEKHIGEFMQTY